MRRIRSAVVFLALVCHAAPQRAGFGHVEAFAEAQCREAHMIAAVIIQPMSGERDEASVQRHGVATMKQF
jgi:hypothetical protein